MRQFPLQICERCSSSSKLSFTIISAVFTYIADSDCRVQSLIRCGRRRKTWGILYSRLQCVLYWKKISDTRLHSLLPSPLGYPPDNDNHIHIPVTPLYRKIVRNEWQDGNLSRIPSRIESNRRWLQMHFSPRLTSFFLHTCYSHRLYRVSIDDLFTTFLAMQSSALAG